MDTSSLRSSQRSSSIRAGDIHFHLSTLPKEYQQAAKGFDGDIKNRAFKDAVSGPIKYIVQTETYKKVLEKTSRGETPIRQGDAPPLKLFISTNGEVLVSTDGRTDKGYSLLQFAKKANTKETACIQKAADEIIRAAKEIYSITTPITPQIFSNIPYNTYMPDPVMGPLNGELANAMKTADFFEQQFRELKAQYYQLQHQMIQLQAALRTTPKGDQTADLVRQIAALQANLHALHQALEERNKQLRESQGQVADLKRRAQTGAMPDTTALSRLETQVQYLTSENELLQRQVGLLSLENKRLRAALEASQQENLDLKSLVATFPEEKKALTEKIRALAKELDEQKAAAKAAQNDLEHFKRTSEASLEEVTRERDQFRQDLTQKTKDLDTANATIRRLEAEKKALEHKLQGEINTVSDALKQTQAELKNRPSREEFDALSQKLRDLQRNHQEVTEALDRATHDKRAIQEEVLRVTSELNLLRPQLSALEDSNRELTATAGALQGELNTLQGAKQELDALKARYADLQGRAQHLESQAAEAQRAIHQLTDEKAQIQAQLSDLEEDNIAQRELVRNAQIINGEITTTRDELRSQVDTLSAEKNRLSTRLAENERELLAARGDKETIRALTEQNRQLTTQLDALEAQIGALRERNGLLEAQAQELSGLQNMLRETSTQLDQANQEKATLTAQVADLTEKLRVADTTIETKNALIEKLQGELRDKDAELKQKDALIAQLQGALALETNETIPHLKRTILGLQHELKTQGAASKKTIEALNRRIKVLEGQDLLRESKALRAANTRIGILEAQSKAKDLRITELEHDVATVTAVKDKAFVAIRAIEARVREQDSTIEGLRANLQRAEGNAAILTNDINTIRIELNQANEARRLQEAAITSEEEVALLRQKLAGLTQLKADLLEAKRRGAQLLSDNATLTSKVAELQTQLESAPDLSETVAALQTTIRENELELYTLRELNDERLDNAQKDLKIDELTAEIARVRSALEGTEEEPRHSPELLLHIQSLETALLEKTAELQAYQNLERQFIDLQAALSNTKAQLEETTSESKRMSDEFQEAIAALEKTVRQKEATIAAQKETITQMHPDTTVDALKAKLARFQKDSIEQAETIGSLQTKLADYHELEADLTQKADTLWQNENTIQRLTTENEELIQKVQALEEQAPPDQSDEVAKLNGIIQQNQALIGHLNHEVAIAGNAQTQLAEVLEEKAALTASLQTQRNLFAATQRELNELKETHLEMIEEKSALYTQNQDLKIDLSNKTSEGASLTLRLARKTALVEKQKLILELSEIDDPQSFAYETKLAEIHALDPTFTPFIRAGTLQKGVMEEKIAGLEELISQKEDLLRKEQHRIVRMQTTIDSMEERDETFRQDLTALLAKVGKEAKSDNLDDLLKEISASYEAASLEQIDALKFRFDTYLAEANRAIAIQAEDLDAAARREDALRLNLAAAEQKQKAAEASLARALERADTESAATIQALQTDVAKQKGIVTRLTGQLSAAQEQFNAETADLAADHARITRELHQYRGIEEHLSEALRTIEETNTQVREQKALIESLQGEKETLFEILEKAKTVIEANIPKEDLEPLQERLAETEATIKALQERNTQLEAKLLVLNEQRAEFERIQAELKSVGTSTTVDAEEALRVNDLAQRALSQTPAPVRAVDPPLASAAVATNSIGAQHLRAAHGRERSHSDSALTDYFLNRSYANFSAKK
jgi:chromosome segregation ATPase